MGILHVRDLLQSLARSPHLTCVRFCADRIFIPKGQRAVITFQQLKQQPSSLAIGVDEYGQTASIIMITASTTHAPDHQRRYLVVIMG